MSEDPSDLEELAGRCARAAKRSGLNVAVAESLTSGAIAVELGKAPDAGEWFAGGVVAYRPEVKFTVLGVTPGPVITHRAAREMVAGVLRALGADVAVAVTGAGGPGPEEGEPAGTVIIGHGRADVADAPDRIATRQVVFDGEPAEVVRRTVEAALEALLHELEASG